MSPVSQPAEPDLRDRLGGALPDSYPSLDLDAVLASGRRTVRRRQVGGLVAVAAAALVVAVGATQLAGGPLVTAPQPAQTSSWSATRYAAGEAEVRVGQINKPEHTWSVKVSATGDDGRQAFQWQELGTDHSFGSAVVREGARPVWGVTPGSPFVVGLLPDDRAGQAVLTTDSTHGDSALQVVPVRGTGWSVFVMAFDKPFEGFDRINDILWFDALGRPVDGLGQVGTMRTMGQGDVWLTADGATLGETVDGGVYHTPLPGSGEKDYNSEWPQLTFGGKDGDTSWRTLIRLRPEAASAALVLSDGRRVPVTPTRLGQWSVAQTPTLPGPTPTVTKVEWTSMGGVQHEDTVTP